jgi:hypothetical protein
MPAPPDEKCGPLVRRPATSEAPATALDASNLRAGADRCGVLTAALTRCARTPEPGSAHCAEHRDGPG